MAEFAENGFAGARINEIAEKTQTSKRMLYYYFGDKRGLYRETLGLAYRRMREQEQAFDETGLSATAAFSRFVELTFRDRINQENFMRLVAIENIHRAQHLAEFDSFRKINAPAVERVASLYQRGVESGEFAPGCDPLELHWFISALSTFNVANRHTFVAAFGDELYTEAGQERLTRLVVNAALNMVRQGEFGLRLPLD